VGLAGIGRPEQGDEAARHLARRLERGRILGQVDAFLGARGVALFLLALDGVFQALADALEHVLGRLGLDVLRHQDLEGVLATVVRYFGGIKLGAGGLVRAYTDSVAQALLTAEKVAIIKLRHLVCTAPYAMEGMVRRELEAAGANLDNVGHSDEVRFEFNIADTAAAALITRLNDAGHGRIVWIKPDEE
jgi:putative IMPACT (imprinted ancient) family translation regulator